MRVPKILAAALAAAALSLPVALADPPKPAEVTEAIELPPAPKPVVPPPTPGLPVKLTGHQLYDVRCKVPCVVRAYPADRVTITRDDVPAGETLRAKDDFTDGEKEHRYKGPMTVYAVKAAGVGPVELVITPIGFKAEKEIVTVGLDVDAGQGPQPPPGPKPPTPPVPVVGQGDWLIVIADETRPSEVQLRVTDGPTLNAFKLVGKSRLYGNVSDADKLAAKKYDKAMTEAKVTAPCVLVLNADGKVTTAFPLPITDADMAAKAKEVLK